MADRYWTDGGADGDWTDTSNWSGATVPVNGDNVYIEEGDNNITLNLNQSAVALNSLNIAQNFTKQIGTESAALQVGASTVNIGYTRGSDSPSGSDLIHLDLGSATAAQVFVTATASSAGTGIVTHPLRIIGNKSDHDIFISGSSRVSVMDDPADTGEVRKIVSQDSAQVSIGIPGISSDPTVATLEVLGGEAVCWCALTTLNTNGGTVTTQGGGAITTASVRGGTLVANSTGTITTLNLYGGGADFTQTQAARTVTNCNLYRDGSITMDDDVLTLTNGIVPTGDESMTVNAA